MLARHAVAERLGDQVLVRERDHGDAHAGQAPDLGRVHAARVDHDLGLDVTPLRAHASTRPPATSIPVTRVWVNTWTPPARAPSISA